MVSIQEAAEFLGVSPQTLRRWEREGRLMPDERTPVHITQHTTSISVRRPSYCTRVSGV
jgi:predicted site-specific integrase-resolvase